MLLMLLSPAKTLDFHTPVPRAVAARATDPPFAGDAAELIGVLRRQRPADLQRLMDLSPKLAELNAARHAEWSAAPPAAGPAGALFAKPAVLAFDGDVYAGLDARSLRVADLAWAQQHLVLLSGLYGALRPLDRIRPHRLEMGTALATRAGRDLYAFWGERLADHLAARFEGRGWLLNLASQEYAHAALRPALRERLAAAVPGLQIVDVAFEEVRGGRPQVISFFAKRARGMMARFLVQRRARSAVAAKGFAEDGWRFDAAASGPSSYVFRRPGTGPLGRMPGRRKGKAPPTEPQE
jgi:cytoplasmic iron level regulating protein YaaA (DUF328/UPF0246 family)